MNNIRKILLACVCIAACMTASAMTENANPPISSVPLSNTVAHARTSPSVNKKPISVVIGKAFSVKLKEGTDCGMVKPLDQVSLMVNGMDSGLHPLGCDPATDELAFSLKRGDITDHTAASNTAWQTILGSPWQTVNSDFKRDLRYTVIQPADSSQAQNLGSGKLSLLIASPGFGLIGLVLVAAMWIMLVRLGRESGMLRDADTGKILKDRTYSLARVQMAWWFAIIMGAYIFLWAITKEIPTLSSQALLMMGISGVTGLTSAGIDASRQTKLPASSGNFFDDLLTDADGVTMHRFQVLAVTVILGVMFIIHVASTLAMPEFDATLLGLMGISGGTYLGFKIPENQASDAPATNMEEHKTGYTPEP